MGSRRTQQVVVRMPVGMLKAVPTTDALFAHEVEQKMSKLLAGFGAAKSFLERTKHRTATQLAAFRLERLPA
jgi:hypothetical protein